MFSGVAASERTSSLQETALAVEILASCQGTAAGGNEIANAVSRGVEWLVEGIDRMEHHETWPIGLYFARLWYDERLYPLLFATAALATVTPLRNLDRQDTR
jgi:squalene-hopene/tetraprenyl-beta-curcumene cyclase